MAADPSGDLYAQAQAARKQAQLLAGKLQATRREVTETWQLIRDSWEQAERARADQVAAPADQVAARADQVAARADPDQLGHSAYGRLAARLARVPVIEQAKGIIMAQYGWSEDQAFAALRQVAQRENIKVRDLAASIVARAAPLEPAPRPTGHAPGAAVSDGAPDSSGG